MRVRKRKKIKGNVIESLPLPSSDEFISATQTKVVVTSALCVIPPPSLWDPIQKIRREHDKAYPRWMPHFNLLYPFHEERAFSTIQARLWHDLKTIQPFSSTMAVFHHFPQREVDTVHLQSQNAAGAFKNLYTACAQHFPQAASGSASFSPHLTVAQFSKSSSRTSIAKLQENWVPLSFMVDKVYLISRKDDQPFQVKKVIPLGGGLISDEDLNMFSVSLVTPTTTNESGKKESFIDGLIRAHKVTF